MVEKVVIEVSGKENLDSTIDSVEKLGKVDAANAAQFKKNNEEFKKELSGTSKAINSTVESLKSLVPVISAAFAVQSVIAFGKASLNAFIEAERGEKLLMNAINNNKEAFDRLTASAKKYQATTIYDDDTIIAAQTFLATQGRTEEQINKVISAATNLSAVTGESLQSSVEKLDATYEGSIGRLGKMDSRFKTLTQTQLENGAAVDLVAEKYKGFAEAELETTAGKLKRLENAWGEVKETIGAGIVDLADKIRDNTLTGGLIDQLLFGQSQELKDELLKIKLVQGAMADLNQGMGEFEDARANEAERTIAQQKAAEVQTRNIAFLKAEIKRLSEELEKNGKSVEQNKSDYAALVAVQKELDAILGKTTEKVKEQKKAMEDLPTEMWEQMAEGERQAAQKRIDEEKKTADEIADYKMQSDKDVADYEAELKAERKREIKADTDFEIAEAERAKAAAIQTEQDKADAKKLIIQRSIEATIQLINMALQYQLQINQQETDAALNNLEIRLQKEQITQEQYEKERRTLLREQAKKQKEYAIIQATIETANAVIKAYSDGGPFAGPALAAIAGAVGLAQIAVISATPLPEFEKGGRVKGKRHRDGGTIIEAEEGEYVINRKAAKKIGFDSLNALNKGILPPKMLKQALSEQKNKSFENRLITVLGSSGDFDTYPLERLMKKGIKQERELTETLVKVIKGTSRKRGGY